MSTAPVPETGGPSPVVAARPSTPLRELVPALAGAAVAVGALALATQVPEKTGLTSFSPRWWPEALAYLLLGLSVLHAALALLRPRSAEELPDAANRAGVLRLTAMLLSILGYGVLWYFVDFRVSTAVLLVALVYLGGGRGWKALLVFPAVVTAVLYLLFGVLLRVPI
ncbi:tripartite tricarboxylate transporter TctB family protein [Thermobifida alba]|uniref:tripartite tricarboxylate transporter TctB family protein n=1 Tax=Thermobifida alba TaxID=53522 RepID=UPI0020BE607E|nr:tripartite tricarboxylate transporter TctB family protein [Thermobifida alba]